MTSTNSTAGHIEPPAPSGTTVIREMGFGYFPIAFMARFPFAMMIVGTLTLVVSARESISLGGLNSALVGLGGALGGPLIGAAADRFGQRPVLLTIGTANGLAMIALAWVAYSGSPDAVLLAVGFATGATAPQAGPLSRSRLVQIISARLPLARRARAINGTMAYESAADEMTFVFGPVLVGVLATLWGAGAAMFGAAAITFLFVTAFALHRTASAIAPGQHEVRGRSSMAELFRPRVLVLVAGALAMGFLFGSVLTALIAFMADRGDSDAAGLIYGVLGVGSAVVALGSARLPARFTHGARWVVFATLMLGGAVLFGMADGLGAVTVAVAITGCGAGPAIVTFYSLAADRAPRGRYSTVMTMIGASITVGQALASAVTGEVAQSVGTAASQWMAAIAAASIVAVGAANMLITAPSARPSGH